MNREVNVGIAVPPDGMSGYGLVEGRLAIDGRVVERETSRRMIEELKRIIIFNEYGIEVLEPQPEAEVGF